MGTHICLLLFIPIMCCSSIFAQPITHKGSMYYTVTQDHLLLKSNNVIQSIWQQESLKSCDVEKPSNASLKNKAFLQFGFTPYLCVILYDASLRYISLNNSHIDNSRINSDIAQSIISEFKPEMFCQKMKENSWFTNIEENKLWVSHFNASMNDGSSCQRYCVADIVNPLCAYALWLDQSIKDAVSNRTQPVNVHGSPVQIHPRLHMEHTFTVANNSSNGKSPDAAIKDNADTKPQVHVPPVREPGTGSLEQLRGALMTGQSSMPSTVGAASRAVDSEMEHEISGLLSSYKKDVHGVSNAVHKGMEQIVPRDGQDDGRFIYHKTSSQEHVEQSTSNSYISQDTGFAQTENLAPSKPIEVPKTNYNGVMTEQQHTQRMDPSNTSPKVEGTDEANQKRKPDQSSLEQVRKHTEGIVQAVTATIINEPNKLVAEKNNQQDTKVNDVQETSQNKLPGGDQGSSLPAEYPPKAESEDPIRQGQEREDTRISQQIEHSNTEGVEQADGELNGAVSGEPDNIEKLKAKEEGTLGSRGDEVDSIGEDHRVLDQPSETDDDMLGERKELATEEPRFLNEGDDPAPKSNVSPKLSDYGGSDEDDDPVNEEPEKGQNDADVGMYIHDRFVDAEDSHFFAYFMTMIILCIIGYLIFHNKQKILALALEGRVRKGSRRRPSTSGYRKLDSNLEEAVTSNCAGSSVTHVIY